MNQNQLDQHLSHIAHRLYNHLEETGRFRRHANPVIPMILEEIYKPLVRRINEECNERIDLYQREIELLKGDLERLRAEKGLNFVGLVGDYRIYAKKEEAVEWMCNYAYSDPEIVEVQVDRDGCKQTCVVEFWRDEIALRWIFKVNDELLKQTPEGIHAVLGLALMELKYRWSWMSEDVKRMMETANSIFNEVYGPQLKANIELAKKIQEEQQVKWNTLPRRTKLYRRTKGWIYWKRRSLGEFIAGEKFGE